MVPSNVSGGGTTRDGPPAQKYSPYVQIRTCEVLPIPHRINRFAQPQVGDNSELPENTGRASSIGPDYSRRVGEKGRGNPVDALSHRPSRLRYTRRANGSSRQGCLSTRHPERYLQQERRCQSTGT